MIDKTEGIIFRSLKYGESSLIHDIYTQKYGLRSFIISGVRGRKKGKTQSGLLQIMNVIELVAYFKNNDALNRIKEVKVSQLYVDLPFNPVKRTVGLFMVELCRKTIKESEQNEVLYDFLISEFKKLDASSGELSQFPIFFMLKLLFNLGIGIDISEYQQGMYLNIPNGVFEKEDSPLDDHQFSQRTSAMLYLFINQLGNTDYSIDEKSLTRKDKLDLIYDLIRYFQWHIDGFGQIKSIKILQEILHE